MKLTLTTIFQLLYHIFLPGTPSFLMSRLSTYNIEKPEGPGYEAKHFSVYLPLFSVVLVRVDYATYSLVHEESIDGLRRREETARSRGELEVVVGEEVEDSKGERVDTVLGVVGHLDVWESMLEKWD